MHRVVQMILWVSLIPLLSSGGDVSFPLASWTLVPYIMCREEFELNYCVDGATYFSCLSNLEMYLGIKYLISLWL